MFLLAGNTHGQGDQSTTRRHRVRNLRVLRVPAVNRLLWGF